MAEFEWGWIQFNPQNNVRDWSTFTTIFPGADPSWERAFRVKCACPPDPPPVSNCSVFLVADSRIILMEDFSTTTVLATGPESYIDIARVGDKIYARTYSGSLDEYTWDGTSLTLTTPNIHNIGPGASLGSDGDNLLYDIRTGPSAGMLGKISTLTWTGTVHTLGSGVQTQGDLMLIGDNKIVMSTFTDGSSLEVWTNTTTPVQTNSFLIKDTSGTLINAVFGFFQKDGLLYALRGDGKVYLFHPETLNFSLEAQLTLDGAVLGSWNGATQSDNCGTIVIEDKQPPSLVYSFQNNGAPTTLNNVTATYSGGSLYNTESVVLSTSTPNFREIASASGPYHIEFTPTSNLNAELKVVVDNITESTTNTLITPTLPFSYTDSTDRSLNTSLKYEVVVTNAVKSARVRLLSDDQLVTTHISLEDISFTYGGTTTTGFLNPFDIDTEDQTEQAIVAPQSTFEVSFTANRPALADVYMQHMPDAPVFIETILLEPPVDVFNRSYPDPDPSGTNLLLIRIKPYVVDFKTFIENDSSGALSISSLSSCDDSGHCTFDNYSQVITSPGADESSSYATIGNPISLDFQLDKNADVTVQRRVDAGVATTIDTFQAIANTPVTKSYSQGSPQETVEFYVIFTDYTP